MDIDRYVGHWLRSDQFVAEHVAGLGDDCLVCVCLWLDTSGARRSANQVAAGYLDDSLALAGLACAAFPETATFGLELAVIGAVLGYVPLWLLAQAYRLIRGRDGLGMGDLKLLAAMGAWSGPWVLPQVIFVAALLAILGFLLERLLRHRRGGLQEERPFGPWLILAYGLIVLAPISGMV